MGIVRVLCRFLLIIMNSLDISLRDSGDCVSNLGMAEDAFNGKNILIVDDINDQGSTVNWIKNDWPSGCLPMIRIACTFRGLWMMCLINCMRY